MSDLAAHPTRPHFMISCSGSQYPSISAQTSLIQGFKFLSFESPCQNQKRIQIVWLQSAVQLSIKTSPCMSLIIVMTCFLQSPWVWKVEVHRSRISGLFGSGDVTGYRQRYPQALPSRHGARPLPLVSREEANIRSERKYQR